MGWVFGGIWVHFDARSLLDRGGAELSALVDPILLHGDRAIDGGLVALSALGLAADAADAPLSLGDATDTDVDDLAVGFTRGCTLVHGARLGLSEPWEEIERRDNAWRRYRDVSERWGEVLVFWCDDRGNAYLFARFARGAVRRVWGRGAGVLVDEGAALPEEPDEATHPHDHLMCVLEAFLGEPWASPALLGLPMERFTPARLKRSGAGGTGGAVAAPADLGRGPRAPPTGASVGLGSSARRHLSAPGRRA